MNIAYWANITSPKRLTVRIIWSNNTTDTVSVRQSDCSFNNMTLFCSVHALDSWTCVIVLSQLYLFSYYSSAAAYHRQWADSSPCCHSAVDGGVCISDAQKLVNNVDRRRHPLRLRLVASSSLNGSHPTIAYGVFPHLSSSLDDSQALFLKI